MLHSARSAEVDPVSLPFHASELEDWVDRVPMDAPVAAAGRLRIATENITSARVSLRERFDMLEILRDKAQPLLQRMEAQLVAPPLPLPPSLSAMAMAANDLLRALGYAYAELVSEARRGWRRLAARGLLQAALVPAMRLHRQRLKLAHRLYARGSKSIWAGLHRLYRIAGDEGLQDAVSEEERESPRAIYCHALLLAFSDPTRLAPLEQDRVAFYLERYGGLAQLEPATALTQPRQFGTFLVSPGEPHPGRSLARARDVDLVPDDLLLRCAPLIDRLKVHIAGLEAGTQPARLGLPLVAAQPDYVEMLKKLVAGLSGSRTRRHGRSRFDPRVETVVGFAKLWNFVSAAAYRRRQSDPAAASHDLMQWAVVNESPNGYALRYLCGNAKPMPVGEILGIRTCDHSGVHIALLRRAYCTGEGVIVGVEVLATQSRPASISIRGAASVRAIYLPAVPALGSAAGLLAPPAGLDPGFEFAVTYAGERRLMRIARRVERGASCDLFALEEASVSATPRA